MLLVTALGFSACIHGDRLPAEELSRQTNRMTIHLLERDYDGLAAWFTDTAELMSPGGYRVQGREVIGDFWRRYHQPLSWTNRTRGVTRDSTLLLPSSSWMKELGEAPAGFYRAPPAQVAYAYLWADWQIDYEDLAGLTRKEELAVLLQWVETPELGWRINKLYFR